MKILRYAAMAMLVIGVHATQAMSGESVMQALKNQEAMFNAAYKKGYSMDNFYTVSGIAKEVYRLAAEFVNQNVKGMAPFDTKTSYSTFSSNENPQNNLEQAIWGDNKGKVEAALGEITYKVPENKRNEVDAVLKEARRIFKRCDMLLFGEWYSQAM